MIYYDGYVLEPFDLNRATLVSNLGTLSSGNLTFDTTNNRLFTVTLATSITSFTITNSDTGYLSVLLAITQGGSGNNTIAFPSNFRWQGGYSPSLSTAVGATDVLQIVSFDNAATWFASIAIQAPPIS